MIILYTHESLHIFLKELSLFLDYSVYILIIEKEKVQKHITLQTRSSNIVFLTSGLVGLTQLTHHINSTRAHAHFCRDHLPSTWPSCVCRSEELAGHALARGKRWMLSDYLLLWQWWLTWNDPCEEIPALGRVEGRWKNMWVIDNEGQTWWTNVQKEKIKYMWMRQCSAYKLYHTVCQTHK